MRRLCLLSLLAAPACSDETPADPSAGVSVPAESGAAQVTAPEPRIVRLAELEARLAELRGKPLLINLWATW